MIEWIFSIGVVLAALALLAGLGVFGIMMGMDFPEFLGMLCLIGFIIACVCGVHDSLYGGGK